ncbi:MAG TPA: RidA family protein [Ferrovibrio sp.]|jgi:enamine deaminase RidA (YjgF/YER057c/UK114 family)|uniref:RidA family protein n=1 Tax=Ferrovibrio sp. TaxID=1917215 RepID=UPI002B4B5DEF|nr:RidA family protein [Ferrovibrio sp.]HLT77421.1 RidA family protein [Ferrovibrio sp.]
MTIDRMNPEGLSKPTGYSHVAVVSAGRQVHISGQVAFDASGAVVGKGDIGAQAEQVYANLAKALAAAGADFSKVFKMNTYVVGLKPEMLPPIRAARAKHFGDGPYPASTLVGVTALVHPDLLIEVEVSALLD